MKILKYPSALLLLAVAVVAAACGGTGGPSNTPEGAAKAWFDAAFAGNAEGVRAQTCDTAVEMMPEAIAAFNPSGDTMDASRLVYMTANLEGTTAVVTVNGSATTTIEGQVVETPLDGVIVPLALEDGAWKVCIR